MVKASLPPPQTENQHNISLSQFVLFSICAPGLLMLSGCLPASCWGMATS